MASCAHVAVKHAVDVAVANGPNQKWHYDSKTGFITGFDGRVLDVKGNSKDKGARVQVFDKKPGNEPNQIWEYKDGSIIAKNTGFVLDVNGGKMENGNTLIVWDNHGGANQKWDIDHFGFIRSRANPAFGLDVAGGKAGKGPGDLILWTLAATPAQSETARKLALHQNQRWHYDSKSGFITAFDGRVLDVEGGSKAQGAKVILYPKKANDNANQQWDHKDGFFVTRMGTGFCIDISGGTYAPRTEIILWPQKPNDNNNQKWDIDEYGFIRSRGNASFGLDIGGGPVPKPNDQGRVQLHPLLHAVGGKL